MSRDIYTKQSRTKFVRDRHDLFCVFPITPITDITKFNYRMSCTAVFNDKLVGLVGKRSTWTFEETPDTNPSVNAEVTLRPYCVTHTGFRD